MAYDFDEIARDYDRMNHLMTAGLDRCWRKRAVQGLHGKVLDVACGTGDMVVELLRTRHAASLQVTGVDLSEEMLAIAKRKAPQAEYRLADAEHLPFGDASFDAVTCAFGVRNFVHLEQGLKEMVRVLKPGGRMAILELATPDNPFIRFFYNIYTRRIIPWFGSRIAGNREAYTYLPSSIERFPKGAAMVDKLMAAGGRTVEHRKLTFGVCRLYILVK
ncbi:MAG: bifunctional demethylmenaquinone methyltransferase/2-methoxy-6-polyprenyl-1,4-benzoquinol methylase UbiE [Bacteroidales bacterium]|nr:bifunctional demethylmenaquinone methyltransferase/2-methoxy-6-polyprenyl-1,4-benzoquinol methylase UbiE [Bacteroidales bacterium]